ncbi:hypothetical protein AB6A40_002542 [Gnathostoma spinigerum]|uniref:Transducer of regulated CREB activity N-terminal domain-containing protein n=1 Tax=Gnathostoma spinigerum TaxID=75299 RepID=A0ABD6E6V5_9BILA
MAQGTPRKFSEKIAIMERKQNEDQEAFTSVMRDVRAITSTSTNAAPFCSSPSALAPPLHWNRPGGSLPNVHEMVQQPIPNWPYWPPQNVAHSARGRSPGAHSYHPYKPQVPLVKPVQERVPPLDYHRLPYPPINTLQPPDMMWLKARSDPAIHMNVLYQQQQQQQQHHHQQQQQQQQPRPSPFMMSEYCGQPSSAAFQPSPPPVSLSSFDPYTIAPSSTSMMNATCSMPQSRVSQDDTVVGSLPNINGPFAPAAANLVGGGYHPPVTQRHSTGVCQTLTTPVALSESQSAPTSPAQSLEMPTPTTWPARKYSNSPESLEIPNIVLTGTDGQLDCFQDLQDLHLDPTDLQQLLNNNEQVDPACETQLLD